MIDIIPLQYYTPFFYFVTLLVVLGVFINLQSKGFQYSNFGFVWVVFIVLLMGLRPISFYFGDMGVYAGIFKGYQLGDPVKITKDALFNSLMKGSSNIMSAQSFFFLCAVLYVYPLYTVSKKWFGVYWFYAFLFLMASFSFWAYGTNGIRNGLAGSFFLMGLSRDKKVFQYSWLTLSLFTHFSMILPIIGFVLAQFYNKPKQMLAFWVLCIPLSLIAGGFWENFFAGLGFGGYRTAYLTGNFDYDFEFDKVEIRFRWDFLLYSASAVFAGWYYIVKKNYQDKVYHTLFNTYVFANAIWILVIRSHFSNRFAYLSWFMMALVIVYPLLKHQVVKNQPRNLSWILLVYFGFTFLMTVILGK